jgi:hypothetical protein
MLVCGQAANANSCQQCQPHAGHYGGTPVECISDLQCTWQ